MSENYEHGNTRGITRRVALSAIGATTAGLAAISPGAADPGDERGQETRGKASGRPIVSASIDCDGLRLERSDNGPQEVVHVIATREDGIRQRDRQVYHLRRGETVVGWLAGSSEEWDIEAGHPAVTVEPSTIVTPECI